MLTEGKSVAFQVLFWNKGQRIWIGHRDDNGTVYFAPSKKNVLSEPLEETCFGNSHVLFRIVSY